MIFKGNSIWQTLVSQHARTYWCTRNRCSSWLGIQSKFIHEYKSNGDNNHLIRYWKPNQSKDYNNHEIGRNSWISFSHHKIYHRSCNLKYEVLGSFLSQLLSGDISNFNLTIVGLCSSQAVIHLAVLDGPCNERGGGDKLSGYLIISCIWENFWMC